MMPTLFHAAPNFHKNYSQRFQRSFRKHHTWNILKNRNYLFFEKMKKHYLKE